MTLTTNGKMHERFPAYLSRLRTIMEHASTRCEETGHLSVININKYEKKNPEYVCSDCGSYWRETI